MTTLSLFIGWDSREDIAYQVAAFSVRRHASQPVTITPLKIEELRAKNLYRRITEIRDGKFWDVISEAHMSTEFAITRFLTPHMAETDWAIFCDCDFLWRVDIYKILAALDDQYAVMCVKHDHRPAETVKMDNQAQLQYARKNWSSMMAFNRNHPANKALTVDLINTVPGRDLHRFCWLKDEDIGGLPVIWNWLEGNYDKSLNPHVIHYTRGGPWFDNWKHVDFAKEWLDEKAMYEASVKKA
jgi:lipopolysaccharide biosynthesis glycosyltransferase